MNLFDELLKLSPEEAIPETQYRVRHLASGWWRVERDWGGDHWSPDHIDGELAQFSTETLANYAKTAIIARQRLGHAKLREARGNIRTEGDGT